MSLLRGARRALSALSPIHLYRNSAEAVGYLRDNSGLARKMAVRELKTRYAGQLTGQFWIVGHPLFMTLIFVFIFGVVFNQRIGGTYDLPRDYTTYILAGLVPWLATAPALSSACLSVISNAGIIKQFQMGIEIFPVKDVIISMIFLFVGVIIIAFYGLFFTDGLPWTWILLPVVMSLHFIIMFGVAWALSSITVFFKDMKDVIQVMVTAFVYILPIVYLPDWVPAIFKPIIYINPFSYLIWVYQDILYFGRFEHPIAWIITPLMAIFSLAIGWRVFKRLKPHFGSVL